MKKRIYSFLIVLTMLLLAFGCNSKSKNETDKKTQNVSGSSLNYDRISEFESGIAIADKTTNLETIHYVVDENFNVLFSYKGNSTFVSKYMKIVDKDDNTKTNIVNIKGDIVYSYDDKEYKKTVELVSDGLLVITEQLDTYNTSKTLTGIYDIESQKYVLEPSEKYVEKIKTYGDNMLTLNDDYTEFYNTKTKKVIKFEDSINREFKDGYSLETNYNSKDLNTYIVVYSDTGTKKEIKTILNTVGNEKEHYNGMLFDTRMRIEFIDGSERITGTHVQLYNLEKGTAKDLSDTFISTNGTKFNEDGNALVRFENQGGETYYTIIDKEGKMLFDPVKRNNEASFGAESNGVLLIVTDDILYKGGYFIGEENDRSKLLDKNNKVVVTGEEYETFKSVSNNSILVRIQKPGQAEKSYYKDLDGNIINLKFADDFKEYN